MSPAVAEGFLHEKIPLSHSMGVRVERCDASEVTLTAPLEPNHNHLGTAFGGSLAALATLAGYTFLWAELGDPAVHIVIRRSELDYLRPVRGVLRASCQRPEESGLARFRDAFAKTGKARISLEVTVTEEDEPCLQFRGVFVAIR